jgi:hypothetical protein
MKSMKQGLLAIGLLTLGACAAPAISDIATDKVKVQGDDLKLVEVEAARGCAIYNRVPMRLSVRKIPTGPYTSTSEWLFACMDPTNANVIPRIGPTS